MILRKGSRGLEVANLQSSLQRLGFYIGRVDGIYGPATAMAVMALQRSRGLLVDGIAGPQTQGVLRGIQDRAAATRSDAPPPASLIASELHACDPRIWEAWLELVKLLTTAKGGEVVRYGPGRGLWVDNRWVITLGPGRLEHTRWRSRLRRHYPSLHCSSLTNWFMAWLLDRAELYTHSGNIPTLHDLCARDGGLHQQRKGKNGKPVARPYRGYGEHVARLARQGGKLATLTWPEVLERVGELATFTLFAQSTWTGKRWKLWHHCGIIYVDHTDPARPVKRIAADGWAGKGRVYSGTPMDVEDVTAGWAQARARNTRLQLFRVRPRPDGLFAPHGGLPRPVELEVA